jgi:hypothetical protein
MARAAKKRTARSQRKQKWLVFVDTNVLLDFYRLGGESAKRTLATLEHHQASLITTDQVWMEFLKNRQKVILQTLGQMAVSPNNSMPPFINELKAVKKHSTLQSSLIKSHTKVKQIIEKILKDPPKYDLVYQSLSKIFERDHTLNLKRPDKQRYAIRHLARKRFGLGYPPRKDDTLRFGDSINWEWVIQCAKASKGRESIIIVSRDGDYGAKLGHQIILNDWLRLEFKERVSQKRNIELTDRLSNALKKLDVSITNKDLAEENRLLKETDDLNVANWNSPLSATNWNRVLLNQFVAGAPATEFRIFVPKSKADTPPTEDQDK